MSSILTGREGDDNDKEVVIASRSDKELNVDGGQSKYYDHMT